MATIREIASKQVSPIERFVNMTDTIPSTRGIAELLITLGQKTFENSLDVGWMRMPQIAELCRRYRLSWRCHTTKARDLELCATDYFAMNSDLAGGGVRVDWRTEWNETKRRQELLLRFRKLYPDGSCA